MISSVVDIREQARAVENSEMCGEPGAMGTPTSCAISRATSLLPIWRIFSALGPTNIRPFSAQAAAKRAFSDKKP